MKKFTLVRVAQQLYKTAREAASLSLRGNFRLGLHWFWVKNKVSLLCDTNSGAEENPKLKDLTENGFQELQPIGSDLTDSLVNFFLKRHDSEKVFVSLSDYFESNQKSGFVRSVSVPAGIEKENEFLKQVFDETNVDHLACEYLGLRREDVSVNAHIESLTRITTERQYRDGYDDALVFHRDTDSLKFVKAFIYLKDIDIGFEHHELFLKSHRGIPLSMRTIRRRDKEEISKKMPWCEHHKVFGKRGYAWIENTTSFHRGTTPVLGDRLIMTIIFYDSLSASKKMSGTFYPLSEIYGS